MDNISKPSFVSPYKEESGGVDFLGLRQVNLTFIDQFLPGINNVTFSLRPYAVMCWLSWAFKEAASKSGITEPKKSQFDQFREKTEILFNWGHQLSNTGVGMAGNAQIAPNNGDGLVPLKFLDWNRNVSWFDAVNYGPSLKVDNGLGFLVQIRPDIYAATELGKDLAEGLDASLRKCDSYHALSSLTQLRATKEEAIDLYEAWQIHTPTTQESKIFCNALYDEDLIDKSTRIGQRSASIKLILLALKSINKPVSADELRKFIAYRNYPFSNKDIFHEQLAERHILWRVLQVRQAHRLAFEVLFGWIESCIFEFSRSSTEEIISDLIEILNENTKPLNADIWVSDKLSKFEALKKSSGTLFVDSSVHKELDIFEQMELILEEVKSDRDASVVRALEILLLCALLSDELQNDQRAFLHTKEGGTNRISLDYWAKFVQSNKSAPISIFISKLIENFLLSQHFGVAAARYTEGKQRLRLTIEERGLVSMLKYRSDIWEPNIARDRLNTILSLMQDAGLLKSKDSAGIYKYSLA